MPRRNRYKIKSASGWIDKYGRTHGSTTVEDTKQDLANPDFQKKYRTKEITLHPIGISRRFLGNFKRPRTTRASFYLKPKLAKKILNIRGMK